MISKVIYGFEKDTFYRQIASAAPYKSKVYKGPRKNVRRQNN